MCNNCINNGIMVLPPAGSTINAAHAQSENEELRKQVSALTQALETQSRENHPYIKELEDRRDFYKENYEYMQRMYSPVGDALHKAIPLLKRALNTKGLPEGLHDDISNFLSNLKDATGGDKPEQEHGQKEG